MIWKFTKSTVFAFLILSLGGALTFAGGYGFAIIGQLFGMPASIGALLLFASMGVGAIIASTDLN